MTWSFDRSTWELVPNPHGRIRPWMILLIAPLLGAAFAIYLPTIGLWLMGRVLGEQAGRAVLSRMGHRNSLTRQDID